MQDGQFEQFRNATHCYLCNKSFDTTDKKVRDHCHLTGNYRGAAHINCNLKCRNDRVNIDFFFHNIKGYDNHFIINAVAELSKEFKMEINCIPINTEKYMSFSIKGEDFNITFKDSMQFMACSLDILVKTKNDSNSTFKYMKKIFRENAEMLIRKGVFPYDWYDSPEKDKYTSLPSREAFK